MYDLKTSVSTMTLRKLLILKNENKDPIFKLQTFFVSFFTEEGNGVLEDFVNPFFRL